MMVQLFFTFPLFICSSHSWIEMHGPGNQATAPSRKGGVAVSSTTSHKLEFRSESHIQVTRTRKTFQTFANAAVVRRSVLKNRNFCRLGTVGKGTAQILRLCLHKINEKLGQGHPRGAVPCIFNAGPFNPQIALCLVRLREPGSQESTAVLARLGFVSRKNLWPGYFRAETEED